MKNKIILLLISISFLIIPHQVKGEEITINIFYGKECHYCESELEYLNSLKKQYKDNITIKKYEVWHNKENNIFLEKVRKELNNKEQGVPYTIIGTKNITGFNDIIKKDIKKTIEKNINQQEIDPVAYIKENKEIPKEIHSSTSTIKLPILGEINPKNTSIPLISLCLGLIDSLNASSLWILLFIISILIVNDKKNTILIALSFIIAKMTVYLTLSYLNFYPSTLNLLILRSIIALISIVIGAIILNKYLDQKDLKIISKIKEKISKLKPKIKNITIIILSFILGLIITSIQISDSSIIPHIYNIILKQNNIEPLNYILNVSIYTLSFILINIIVMLIIQKLPKKQKNYLISGIMLLILGAVLILKPEWLTLI